MIRVMNVISDTNIGGAGRVLLNYLRCADRSRFEPLAALPRGSLLKAPASMWRQHSTEWVCAWMKNLCCFLNSEESMWEGLLMLHLPTGWRQCWQMQGIPAAV